MELWINPECSKCRAATDLLDEAGVPYTVRYYLQDPPTVEELSAVLDRLGLEPWDVTRMGEQLAEERDLARLPHERSTWMELLVSHPSLIQRPIITADDGTTVIGRSPDAVQAVITRESEAADQI